MKQQQIAQKDMNFGQRRGARTHPTEFYDLLDAWLVSDRDLSETYSRLALDYSLFTF